MITFKKINEKLYELYVKENLLGKIMTDESSYFVFVDSKGQVFSEYYFRLIADKLKELNTPYNNLLKDIIEQV